MDVDRSTGQAQCGSLSPAEDTPLMVIERVIAAAKNIAVIIACIVFVVFAFMIWQGLAEAGRILQVTDPIGIPGFGG